MVTLRYAQHDVPMVFDDFLNSFIDKKARQQC